MKQIKLVPILFIIVLMISNVMPISAFSVTVGTIVEYDKMEQVWDFAMNTTNQSSGSGFSFNGVHFPNNTLVSAEVDAATATDIDFNTTVGAESATSSVSHLGNSLAFVFLSIWPMMLTTALDTWDQAELDLGPEIWELFFLDHGNINSLLSDLSDDTYLEEIFDEPEYDVNRVNGTYTFDGDLAIYNYLLDCTFVGTSGLDTYSGNYTYQIVYNTSSDIVQGFELYLNYNGTSGFTDYSIFHYFIFEITGYDLPDFVFEVDVIPEPEPEPEPTPTPTPTLTPTDPTGLLTISVLSISFIGISIIIAKRKTRK